MSNILCIGNFSAEIQACFSRWQYQPIYVSAGEAIELLQESAQVDCVLFHLELESSDVFIRLRHSMLQSDGLKHIPFVVVSDYPAAKLRQLSQKYKVQAHFTTYNAYTPKLCEILYEVLSFHQYEAPKGVPDFKEQRFRIPLWKRMIDLIGASLILLVLSPALLLIALLIKLESKGPVFYISKRAGQGFRVFDFYKFRSMRKNAEHLLKGLKDDNEYRKDVELPPMPASIGPQKILIEDNGFIDEKTFKQSKVVEKAGTFVKIKNDPRVTRIGYFIRKTSIDELPQLFNVLKGDMSLVGNRPIPLYEAEQLTSDNYVARFFAPAGITGLWQITKRKKNNMSEEERKLLDVEYALNYNFWMDFRILWNTLPAALQHENA